MPRLNLNDTRSVSVLFIALFIVAAFVITYVGRGHMDSKTRSQIITLTSESTSSVLTLAWNPNPEPDIAGYELHSGPTSQNYTQHLNVGNVTGISIDPPAGKIYYALTAYNTNTFDSGYSNEVNYTLPTPSPTATATFTPRPTATATATFTPRPRPTATSTATATATATFTPTPTATIPPMVTPSPTPTASSTATATATSTPTVTATVTATATIPPTPTPSPVSISGIVSICGTGEPDVTMTITGNASNIIPTDANGFYEFLFLAGGNYIVTPTKARLIPGAVQIDTIDIIAIQRHFLGLTVLTGCSRDAADVNGDGTVNTVDSLGVQRFIVGSPSGTGDTGKYLFTPFERSYTMLNSNQANQDYAGVVMGDVVTTQPRKTNGAQKGTGRKK